MVNVAQAFDVPAAWRPETLRADQRWICRLSLDELQELKKAVETIARLGRPYEDLKRADLTLPLLSRVFDRAKKEITEGYGVFLIKGIPIRNYTTEEARAIFWLFGIHLGAPVSQNPAGEMIAEVRDKGYLNSDRTARGYQTADPLAFHNDQTDVVGLLCLQPAKEGGLSRIVSAVSVHNAMLERDPALLDELYRPVVLDYRGEEPEGSKPYYLLPVFRRWNGTLFSRYARNHAESAQQLPGVARIPAQMRAAFDAVDALCQSDEFRYDMAFEQGDIQFLNNHSILHSRTRFVDFDEPERKRNLLRIWLRVAEWKFPPPENSALGLVDSEVLRYGIGPKKIVVV